MNDLKIKADGSSKWAGRLSLLHSKTAQGTSFVFERAPSSKFFANTGILCCLLILAVAIRTSLPLNSFIKNVREQNAEGEHLEPGERK
jgi:hypothetical protein